MNRLTIDRRMLLAGALAGGMSGPAWAKPSAPAAQTLLLKTATGRTVKSLLWLPAKPRGLVLFSHGFASAPNMYPDIIDAWVQSGFTVAAPWHVDSPENPDHATYPGGKGAAARMEDIALLADTLTPGFDGYVIAGHSAGGLTAGVMAGARPIQGAPPRDPRIKAAITFSPPGALPGYIDAKAYAGVAVPMFVQTGDLDINTLSGTKPDWRPHLVPYNEAQPTGNNYALVLQGADHFFGGLICWKRPGPPQPQQLAQAVRLSTLFLEAYGVGDANAHSTLDSALSTNWPVMLTRR